MSQSTRIRAQEAVAAPDLLAGPVDARAAGLVRVDLLFQELPTGGVVHLAENTDGRRAALAADPVGRVRRKALDRPPVQPGQSAHPSPPHESAALGREVLRQHVADSLLCVAHPIGI